MKKKGITQDALAERMDVTQGAVQHWLAGTRKPDLDLLLSIATHIDVSPGWLLLGLDETNQLTGLPDWASAPLAQIIQGTRRRALTEEWFGRLRMALDLIGLPAEPDAQSLISSPEVHARARAQKEQQALHEVDT